MKKLIFLTALLSAPAMADDYCSELGKLAKTVMEVRQGGMSMATVMQVFAKDDNEIYKQMVISAYESPRFTVDSYIQRNVEEFSNEWYLMCVKARQ